jgi:hypothetical protein
MNLMTGFSTMPLQFAGLVGFAFAFFRFCLLLVVLARYLLHGEKVASTRKREWSRYHTPTTLRRSIARFKPFSESTVVTYREC